MSGSGRVARHRLATVVALAVAAAGTVGCGLMKRAKVEVYTLSTLPAAPAAPLGGRPAVPAAQPLAVGSVELPPGFERREVVVRADGQRLDVRGTELWSATLETLVLHTLAMDLAERLPEGGVVLPGQLPPAAGVRSLDLTFAELAAGPGAELTLDVRWTLRAGTAAAAPLAAGRERLVEPLGSLASAEVADATSRALAALADRLVAAAAAAPAPAPPPAP